MKIPHNQQLGLAYHDNYSVLDEQTFHSRLRRSWSDKENIVVFLLISSSRVICIPMLYHVYGSTTTIGWGPGAVVEPACLESLRSGVRTPLWNSSFEERKYLFPAHS